MTIRPVESRDAKAWATMRARLWPDASAADLENETRTFLSGRMLPTLNAAFIAEGEGAGPVGFIEVALRAFADGCDSMPVPHVEGWYVEPAARRQGIARRLIDAVETWAGARGFNELASDTETHNVQSAFAHASCGFQEVERLIKFRKPIAAASRHDGKP